MRYSSPGLFKIDSSDATTTLQVRALLFYEGVHTDSLGKRKTYTAKQIGAIATATNEYLAAGHRAKFFEDHQYTQRGTLGAIVGRVEAREIDTVPHEEMTALIGKMGVYGTIEIAGEDNVSAYQDGRIKEISVGIDLAGDYRGIANAIYEVSAVGIPALAGAALFGLTIGQTIQEQDNRRGLWEEWEVFGTVLENIDRATDEEVTAAGSTRTDLKAQAVEDHAARLRVRFPPANQSIPSVPLYEATMDYTPEQIKDLEDRAAKFDAASRELATLRRSSQVSSKFSALKDKAIALKSAGKLTPAQFKAFGFDESEVSIAKFSAGDDAELTRLEIKLDAIEEYATPVKMGLHLAGEPLPGEEKNAAEDEANQFMTGYSPTLRYSNSRSY